jgi:hypothetical protein
MLLVPVLLIITVIGLPALLREVMLAHGIVRWLRKREFVVDAAQQADAAA